MIGQMRLGHPQQLRPGQKVKEIDRAGSANLPTNAISLLLTAKSTITIPQGWSPGWRVWVCGNNHPINLGQPSSFLSIA